MMKGVAYLHVSAALTAQCILWIPGRRPIHSHSHHHPLHTQLDLQCPVPPVAVRHTSKQQWYAVSECIAWHMLHA